MWNFTFVIPSLLVLAVFVGYYFSLPRIPIRINRLFIFLIIVECVVMMLDIASTVADNNYQEFSGVVLYALNSAYFIAFFARAYYFFIFTASALGLSAIRKLSKRLLLAVPFIVATFTVLTTPFTRLFYYMDDTGYHSGPLYNILYYLFWTYLALSFYGVFTRKSNIRKKREYHIIFWYNVILFGGTIIRLIFPRYLLMDTFCLLALISIYLSFENPDFYMEGKTWLFNNRALVEYLNEINGHRKYTIFAFTIHNYAELRELYGTRLMDQTNFLIGEFLRKEYPKEKIFYNRDGRYVILYENGCDKEKVNRKLQDRFRNPWTSGDAVLYLDIGCSALDSENANVPLNILMSLLKTTFTEADYAERDEIRLIGSEHTDKIKNEAEIKRAIAYAISHDQVEAYLQPIVDARTGELKGAEALCRIRDLKGNIISPDLFIPIAERNGRINELGHQVFERVCGFIRDNDLSGLGLSWINVNLSPIQFMRANLGENLLESMERCKIDPKYIRLEITEAAMVDDQLLVNQTTFMKKLGFQFVLDDYGKGYSNVSRLRQCPFVNIKIDMSIVWDYFREPNDLLPNIVRTLSNLGFEITAEGIESKEMADKLAEMGCNYLQGFYFSKALSMEEFLKKYSPSHQ